MQKHCPCGALLKGSPSAKRQATYCSQVCYHKYRIHPFKGVSKYEPKECAICGSEFRKVKHTPEQWKVAKYCSVPCLVKSKIGVPRPDKREPFLRIQFKPKGAKHWNWKGGRTPELHRLRQSKEYKDWRNAVYRRDYWTCQVCGEKPKNIVAHHLKSFNDYPALRYSVENGQTLCRSCHKIVHSEIGEATRFTAARP
jgi:hypothetical protein